MTGSGDRLAPPGGGGRVRVSSFAISLDGYGAGPAQDLENPLGVGGLHADGAPPATFSPA
jgi:hypothetical protein